MSWQFWKYSGIKFPEVTEDDIPSFNAAATGKLEVNAEIFLEVFHMHTARIVARDELGLQVAWRDLGEITGVWSLEKVRENAERMAADDGWTPDGEWVIGDQYDWVMVKPLPFVIKIVGPPLPTDEVMALARQSGYTGVVDVISQEYDLVTTSTKVIFEVNEPPNQVWQSGNWFE